MDGVPRRAGCRAPQPAAARARARIDSAISAPPGRGWCSRSAASPKPTRRCGRRRCTRRRTAPGAPSRMSAPRGYLAVAAGPGAPGPRSPRGVGETRRRRRGPHRAGHRRQRRREAAAVGGGVRLRAGCVATLAPMSAPRIWLGAAATGPTFAVGGYGGSVPDLVEAFVPGPEDAPVGSTAAQGRWVRCASLSQGRSTAGVASCGGVLYCAGGFRAALPVAVGGVRPGRGPLVGRRAALRAA